MTLEGTLLLFLRKNKKWNFSYGLGPEAPFGGGGGCSTIRRTKLAFAPFYQTI